MTPEEFYEKMKEIKRSQQWSDGGYHEDMDDLMCEVLRDLGYGKGVDEFYADDFPRWYE